MVDVALLEHAIRQDLELTAPRVMGVLRPLKLVIDNYPEGQVDQLDCPYFPEDPTRGTRPVPLCRELYVDRDDFREDAPKKWFRLAPGREVRLRHACLVTCTDLVKNEAGEVVELHCTWDPGSRGGNAPDGRKVRGTIHWVSATHALDADVRLYDRLFTLEDPLQPPEGTDFKEHINPDSLQVLRGCKLEPSLRDAAPGSRYQFERLGYFCVDPDSQATAPVFNRTVPLKDSWAKIEKKLQGG